MQRVIRYQSGDTLYRERATGLPYDSIVTGGVMGTATAKNARRRRCVLRHINGAIQKFAAWVELSSAGVIWVRRPEIFTGTSNFARYVTDPRRPTNATNGANLASDSAPTLKITAGNAAGRTLGTV